MFNPMEILDSLDLNPESFDAESDTADRAAEYAAAYLDLAAELPEYIIPH